MTDTFDAVLAEMRKVAPAGWAHIHGSDIDGWADRLAAAHAAEVAEVRDWNERVSVCRDHTADIVDGPCVVCRAEAAETRVRELEGLLIRARNPHAAKCPAAYRDSDTCTCGLDAAL